MNRFRYLTKSHDGKLSGTVSADYIAGALMGRSIKTFGYGDDATFIQFSLSDGGFIRVRVTPEAPEVHYYAPDRK